jgi:hypothetical protein
LEAVWARLPRLDLLQAGGESDQECAQSNSQIPRGKDPVHLYLHIDTFMKPN